MSRTDDYTDNPKGIELAVYQINSKFFLQIDGQVFPLQLMWPSNMFLLRESKKPPVSHKEFMDTEFTP